MFTIKAPGPKQLKYAALVGALIALIPAEIYMQAHSAEIVRTFSRGTYLAVTLIADLLCSVFAYYQSYKLAETPRPGNALGRGAVSGLFTGVVTGSCAGGGPDMAFAALVALPVGAVAGLVNLWVVNGLTKEKPVEPDGGLSNDVAPAAGEENAPSYSPFYAMIGGLFGVVANYIFLIPWQNEMRGRYDDVFASTTILCGGAGLYYGRKIAKTRDPGKAARYGAAGGAWIGVINGTAVFPVIGTVIGGVLGALIGGFFGGPLAFYLIKAARFVLLDDRPAKKTAEVKTEEPSGTDDAEGAPTETLPPPAEAAPVLEPRQRDPLLTIKAPEPKQQKYVALLGALMALIPAETYMQAHSAEIMRTFSRDTYMAVTLIADLMCAIFAYYQSYKLAERPLPDNALLRGAVSGLFTGIVAGSCAGNLANMAFGTLVALPVGAIAGLFNLWVVNRLTRKKPAEEAAVDDDNAPSYTASYAMIGAVFGVAANYLFLLPWQRQMHGRFGLTLTITTVLCGWVGFNYCRKIARTNDWSKASTHGAAGGAWIGVINGTAVVPVIGTAIGGVLGAFIGGFFGGPIAFGLIKAGRFVLLDDRPSKGARPGAD